MHTMRQLSASRWLVMVTLCAGVAAAGLIGFRSWSQSSSSDSGLIATGSVSRGFPDQRYEWDLHEASGRDGVTFAYTSQGRSGNTTVTPRSPNDVVWITATVPIPDAATVAFGGVAEQVDQVVVSTVEGEADLELMAVPGRSWKAAKGDLPAKWAFGGIDSVEVIALSNGVEVGRDVLDGVSG